MATAEQLQQEQAASRLAFVENSKKVHSVKDTPASASDSSVGAAFMAEMLNVAFMALKVEMDTMNSMETSQIVQSKTAENDATQATNATANLLGGSVLNPDGSTTVVQGQIPALMAKLQADIEASNATKPPKNIDKTIQEDNSNIQTATTTANTIIQQKNSNTDAATSAANMTSTAQGPIANFLQQDLQLLAAINQLLSSMRS